MKRGTSNESGQALILLAFGIVALLGFTALAIDGGMIYSDRRHAQNGTDAASLAGGGAAALGLENSHVTYGNWNCNDGRISNARQSARTAAIQRADDNDFTIDQDISDKNGVSATCHVEDNGSWLDKYIDIRTMITSGTQTAFAHFIYAGPWQNEVEAVTRVRPRSPLAFGNAIMSTRLDCPNSNTGGVHFDGNNTVTVSGGGIFSNSCLDAGGSVQVNVVGGDGITCTGAGCYDAHGGPSISPAPEAGNYPIPASMFTIPPPDCSAVPDRGSHTGDGTINPGRYSRIKITNGELELRPGLYCVTGEFDIQGGLVTGSGVTIYITTGNFQSNGNATVQLTAPPARSCADCPPAIPGVLIYLAEGNTSSVTLLGTSDSQYLGLVFAPNGMIEVGGAGSSMNEVHAQLIGDTVKIHGNANLVVNFDDDLNHQRPATLELFK